MPNELPVHRPVKPVEDPLQLPRLAPLLDAALETHARSLTLEQSREGARCSCAGEILSARSTPVNEKSWEKKGGERDRKSVV